MTTAPAPAFDPAIVRAVAFDGFGTIFEYPVARYKETFGQIGARLTPPVGGDALWERWLDVGRKRMHEGSPEEGPDDRAPAQPFRPYRERWPLQFAETFAAIESQGDAEAAAAFLIGEIQGAPTYADAPAVVDAVRRRYPVALVSNADDDFLRPPLEASGLRFDAVISSEAVRAYKPQPAIFERAAEALGVPPASLLYVGDSLRADVTGAVRAGLQVAWLDRSGKEQPQPDAGEPAPVPNLHIASLDLLLPAFGLAR